MAQAAEKIAERINLVTNEIALEESAHASLAALGLEPAEILERITQNGFSAVQSAKIDFSGEPCAAVALERLIHRVRSEERIDVTVKVRDLEMKPTGNIAVPFFEIPQRLTRHALCQLAGRLPRHPAYAGPYWSSIPADRRATEFRHVIADNIARGKGDHEITLRLRRAGQLENEGITQGEHYIFASVSGHFTAYDPDRMGSDVLQSLGESATEVKASVFYQGIQTSVRLLVAQDQGFGVVAHLSSADDATEAVHVRAELLLPSGVAWSGKGGLAARFRHIGRGRTIEDIRLALGKIAEATKPWIEQWKAADKVDVQDMAAALARLTGADDEEAPKRHAWLRVAEVRPSTLLGRLLDRLTDAEQGNVSGLRYRATQAGLAEFLLACGADMKLSPEEREAVSAAGSAIAGLPAHAFLAMIAPKKAGANASLADRIAMAAQGGAKKWRAIAELAEAEGDEQGAELARDRAELREVEGDALIEASDGRGFSF